RKRPYFIWDGADQGGLHSVPRVALQQCRSVTALTLADGNFAPCFAPLSLCSGRLALSTGVLAGACGMSPTVLQTLAFPAPYACVASLGTWWVRYTLGLKITTSARVRAVTGSANELVERDA